MRARKSLAFAAIAIAMAVAYGIWVGVFWVADAVIFTVAASAVAYLSFTERDANQLLNLLRFGLGLGRGRANRQSTSLWLAEYRREIIPRSRIAHYVTVSKIRSTASIAKASDSPFEREILSQPGWRTLSEASLEEVAKRAPHDSAQVLQ